MKLLLAFGLTLLLAACRGQATPQAVAPDITGQPALPSGGGLGQASPGGTAWPQEPPFGVQVFESDVETPALEQLRNAGVTWARTRALWKAIEPQKHVPPRYDWAMSDRCISATTAAGFRNLVVVYTNPSWAAESECGPVRPDRLADYAAFWTALVERYDGDGDRDAPDGGEAHFWQVSNEVDFDPAAPSAEPDYGGCFGHDPVAYAEQLVVAYRAAKAADPQAQVGFGPVAYDRFTASSAPAGWTAPPGPFVYDFTQRALEYLHQTYAGDSQLPFFDFVAIHNYNDNAEQWDRPPLREMLGKLASFRNEQLAVPGVYDLRARPVMISETGLPAGPSDEWTERSEELQAAYVPQTFVRSLAAGAMAAIWYTARDNIFGDCLPPHWDWSTFGLMRSGDFKAAIEERCPVRDFHLEYALSGTADPRPALTALAVLNRLLAGSRFEGLVDAADTGCLDCEVYRFLLFDDRPALVAWATNGQRLGKRGVPAPSARLRVEGSLLAPWSGVVAVTDHLGQERLLGRPGQESIQVELEVAPVYLTLPATPTPGALSGAHPVRRR